MKERRRRGEIPPHVIHERTRAQEKPISPRGRQTSHIINFSLWWWEAGSPVDEIVEDEEHGDGHDGGGEEGVHDEALGVPLDVVGVRAQAGPLKVYGAVRLDSLQSIRVRQ